MADVEEYVSGRILESVKQTEQMVAEFHRTGNLKIKQQLAARSKDTKTRHFRADMHQLKEFIDQAHTVAIGPRICLEIHPDCHKPTDVVFLDELAEGLIRVGKARLGTKDEAIRVLIKGGKQGCPHVVSLVPDKPLELCNTCLDCCVLWQREQIGIETIRK